MELGFDGSVSYCSARGRSVHWGCQERPNPLQRPRRLRSKPLRPPKNQWKTGSPRAILSEYLRLCSEGRYAEAARFLDLPPSHVEKGPLLAKRFKAVIDHYVWLELETISPLSHGNPNDGLPAAYDSKAEIPGISGKGEAVWIFRRGAMGGTPEIRAIPNQSGGITETCGLTLSKKRRSP